MGVINGLASHASRLLMLRHDGEGLPKSPGGGMWMCVGLALLLAVLRHALVTSMGLGGGDPEQARDAHWLGFLFAFGLSFFFVRALVGVPALCAYAIISAAMDTLSMLFLALGAPAWPFMLWECAALVAIAMRLGRAGDKK